MSRKLWWILNLRILKLWGISKMYACSLLHCPLSWYATPHMPEDAMSSMVIAWLWKDWELLLCNQNCMKNWELLKGHLQLGYQMETTTTQCTFHWVWWCPKWEGQESSLMFTESVGLCDPQCDCNSSSWLAGHPIQFRGKPFLKSQSCYFSSKTVTGRNHRPLPNVLCRILPGVLRERQASVLSSPALLWNRSPRVQPIMTGSWPHDSGDSVDLPQMPVMFSGAREPGHHDSS